MRPYYDYGDDRRRDMYERGPSFSLGSALTPAVKWIIVLTVGVFVLEYVVGGPMSRGGSRVFGVFGFVPALAFQHGWIWQFVTYMFLHAGFLHIFFNLFFLWMIGGLAEGRLGAKRFVWLYVLSGIAGALGQAALAYTRDFAADPAATGLPQIYMRTVGASGAVMGVAAAVAALYPNLRILLFFIIPMKMKHFVWVLVVFQLWGLSSASQGMGGDRVAYFAHLAGLAAGYLFIKWHVPVGQWASRAYYRVRGRYRGFTKTHSATPIDDDAEYRREVDRLLDKIFKEGTQSLSREENEFLKKQSKKFKR